MAPYSAVVYKYTLLFGFRQSFFLFPTICFCAKEKASAFNRGLRGATRIWTGDRGVADLCLTTWLWRQMIRAGFEPALPPWKGGVLTPWPTDHKNSPSGTRTCNPPVNSRMLCHWAIEDYYTSFILFLTPSKLNTSESFFSLSSIVFFVNLLFWSSPRSISIGQLNMLPCLHLQPINLIIFKGSYFRRMGNLILRAASRLDAFSVYPFHT